MKSQRSHQPATCVAESCSNDNQCDEENKFYKARDSCETCIQC